MAKSLEHAALNSFLGSLGFPMNKETLIRTAVAKRVPDDLVLALQDLRRANFQSQEQVVEDLGKLDYEIA